MSPPEFLVPLVVLGEAASAAFAAFTSLLIAAALGTPLVLLLLDGPIPRGVWRWPFLWPLIPVVSMIVCNVALEGGEARGGLLPLGVLGGWMTLAMLIGLPRLAFRVLRYALTGKPPDTRGSIDRKVGALGLCAAAIGLAGAIFTPRTGLIALSLFVAALSLASFRAPPQRSAHRPGTRLAWVAGTFLLVAGSLLFAVCAAVLFGLGLPALVGTNGDLKGPLFLIGAVMVNFLGVMGRRWGSPEAVAPSLGAPAT